jgi:chromosome segregation ATPase
MAKLKTAVPDISEVMTGVDMIGTILDLELPKLENRLKDIKGQLDTVLQPESPGKKIELSELANSINELRDMVESQERQIAALDMRLARFVGDPK